MVGLPRSPVAGRYAPTVELDELQRNWNELGKVDPLWAILTDPDKRGNRWDVDEFFGSGKANVEQVVDRLAALGLSVHGSALDFGCGVGRLTQAFADHYDEVWGVDIAPSMIDRAESLNHHGSKVHYVVNDRPDLACFDDGMFDLVFSVIVLQHIRPELAHGYVREFFRICRPGGVVVFQLPSRLVRAALPDAAYAAEITAEVPPRVSAQRMATVPVRVRNTGTVAWPCRPEELRVANHWLDADGAVVEHDSGREPIPTEVPPGGTVDVTLRVPAPATPGAYRLQLDVVHEGIAWFADRGSVAPVTPVRVVDGPVRSPGVLGRFRSAPDSEVVADEPAMEMHATPATTCWP